MGGWAKLADLQTLTEHNVKEIVGGGRRMPAGSKPGPQSPTRRARRPHGSLKPRLGLL